MTRLILLAILALFVMPAPLILFAVLINWRVICEKTPSQNLKELGSTFFSAGLSLFVAISTRPFTFLDTIPLKNKNRNNQPILMVHGLYHNKVAWILMKHRLNALGFSNIHTWQYNSFTTSYPELVLKLRSEIDRIYKTNNHKIILVGHSLGGLLISGATSAPDTKDKALGLITIGTPFKGSILAAIAPGRLGKSLHPESSLFVGDNKITFPNDIPKTAIISPTDEMVLPWANLVPETSRWTIKNSPALGHVAMLYSRRVSRIVANCIHGMIHIK